MVRRIATVSGVLLAALALAAISTWWAVFHLVDAQSIRKGPWRASTATGSARAGMYLRAQTAITGLFALDRSEAIYFTATTDDDGVRLRQRCTYAIIGTKVDARWWSLTAYADDNFLIANAANRFSYNMGNLEFHAGDIFRVVAAPSAQPGDWLPTGTGAGGFSLLFRLYNPAADLAANMTTVPVPAIKRLGDCA